MNVEAIAIIGGVALVVGAVLYLPFFVWFRFRRRRGRPLASKRLDVPLTKGRIILSMLMIAVIVTGYSRGVLAPHTWFGSHMQTGFGQLVWGISVACFFYAAQVIWMLSKRGKRG